MTRKLTWLGGLGVVALTVLGACGGSSPSAQVASLAGSQSGADATTTTTAAATSEADAQQAMLDFAQCMREHGIDMPFGLDTIETVRHVGYRMVNDAA